MFAGFLALDAADNLASQDIDARVINLHTLAPADQQSIIAAARETGAIVTAEEHYAHGGLGSVVAASCPGTIRSPGKWCIAGLYRLGPALELMAKTG